MSVWWRRFDEPPEKAKLSEIINEDVDGNITLFDEELKTQFIADPSQFQIERYQELSGNDLSVLGEVTNILGGIEGLLKSSKIEDGAAQVWIGQEAVLILNDPLDYHQKADGPILRHLAVKAISVKNEGETVIGIAGAFSRRSFRTISNSFGGNSTFELIDLLTKTESGGFVETVSNVRFFVDEKGAGTGSRSFIESLNCAGEVSLNQKIPTTLEVLKSLALDDTLENPQFYHDLQLACYPIKEFWYDVEDVIPLNQYKQRCEKLGIDFMELCKILATILHILNIEFEAVSTPNGLRSCITRESIQPLSCAARLMNVDRRSLEASVFCFGNHSIEEPEKSRDQLCSFLFNGMFQWILKQQRTKELASETSSILVWLDESVSNPEVFSDMFIRAKMEATKKQGVNPTSIFGAKYSKRSSFQEDHLMESREVVTEETPESYLDPHDPVFVALYMAAMEERPKDAYKLKTTLWIRSGMVPKKNSLSQESFRSCLLKELHLTGALFVIKSERSLPMSTASYAELANIARQVRAHDDFDDRESSQRVLYAFQAEKLHFGTSHVFYQDSISCLNAYVWSRRGEKKDTIEEPFMQRIQLSLDRLRIEFGQPQQLQPNATSSRRGSLDVQKVKGEDITKVAGRRRSSDSVLHQSLINHAQIQVTTVVVDRVIIEEDSKKVNIVHEHEEKHQEMKQIDTIMEQDTTVDLLKGKEATEIIETVTVVTDSTKETDTTVVLKEEVIVENLSKTEEIQEKHTSVSVEGKVVIQRIQQNNAIEVKEENVMESEDIITVAEAVEMVPMKEKVVIHNVNQEDSFQEKVAPAAVKEKAVEIEDIVKVSETIQMTSEEKINQTELELSFVEIAEVEVIKVDQEMIETVSSPPIPKSKLQVFLQNTKDVNEKSPGVGSNKKSFSSPVKSYESVKNSSPTKSPRKMNAVELARQQIESRLASGSTVLKSPTKSPTKQAKLPPIPPRPNSDVVKCHSKNDESSSPTRKNFVRERVQTLQKKSNVQTAEENSLDTLKSVVTTEGNTSQTTEDSSTLFNTSMGNPNNSSELTKLNSTQESGNVHEKTHEDISSISSSGFISNLTAASEESFKSELAAPSNSLSSSLIVEEPVQRDFFSIPPSSVTDSAGKIKRKFSFRGICLVILAYKKVLNRTREIRSRFVVEGNIKNQHSESMEVSERYCCVRLDPTNSLVLYTFLNALDCNRYFFYSTKKWEAEIEDSCTIHKYSKVAEKKLSISTERGLEYLIFDQAEECSKWVKCLQEANPKRIAPPVRPKPREDPAIANILHELIETERMYVDDLHITIVRYYHQIDIKGLLSRNELNSIFCNIHQVLKTHQSLLENLNENKAAESFAATFKEMMPFIQGVYKNYVCNYPVALSTLAKCIKSKPKLNQFLNSVQKANQPDLEGYLIKPIQRLCKYPLFIRQLHDVVSKEKNPNEELKHNIHEALAAVNQVASEVNRHQQEAVRLNRGSYLFGGSAFEGMNRVLCEPGRIYLDEFPCEVTRTAVNEALNSNKVKHWVGFLFSDVLIFAKKVANADRYKYRAWFELERVLFSTPVCSTRPTIEIVSHPSSVMDFGGDSRDESSISCGATPTTPKRGRRASVLLRRLSIVARTPEKTAVNPLTDGIEKLSLVFENDEMKSRTLQNLSDALEALQINRKKRISRGTSKSLSFCMKDETVIGSFKDDCISIKSFKSEYDDETTIPITTSTSFDIDTPQRLMFKEINNKLTMTS